MATTTSVPTLSNVILSDVNAVIPNFSSLVSSYRLLVGAAEEIKRIPGVPEEMFKRAVLRFDHCGTLIDILLELLCCKIAFSSDFLSLTCAPLDIFQLVTSQCDNFNTPAGVAELIILLEAIRRLLENGCDLSCFGPEPPIGGQPSTPPPAKPPATPQPNQPAPPQNIKEKTCPEQPPGQVLLPETVEISEDILEIIVNEALASLRPRELTQTKKKDTKK